MKEKSKKIHLLKIGGTEKKRCIAAPYQMKMRNKDFCKLHNMDDTSDSINITGNVNYKMNE